MNRIFHPGSYCVRAPNGLSVDYWGRPPTTGMCRLSSARHHNKKGKEIVPKISGPRKLERPQPEAEAVYRGYHAVPLSRARHGIATQHCTSSFLKKIATNKSGQYATRQDRTRRPLGAEWRDRPAGFDSIVIPEKRSKPQGQAPPRRKVPRENHWQQVFTFDRAFKNGSCKITPTTPFSASPVRDIRRHELDARLGQAPARTEGR